MSLKRKLDDSPAAETWTITRFFDSMEALLPASLSASASSTNLHDSSASSGNLETVETPPTEPTSDESLPASSISARPYTLALRVSHLLAITWRDGLDTKTMEVLDDISDLEWFSVAPCLKQTRTSRDAKTIPTVEVFIDNLITKQKSTAVKVILWEVIAKYYSGPFTIEVKHAIDYFWVHQVDPELDFAIQHARIPEGGRLTKLKKDSNLQRISMAGWACIKLRKQEETRRAKKQKRDSKNGAHLISGLESSNLYFFDEA